MKKLLFFCLVAVLLFSLLPVNSAQARSKGKILFVPHDDRPIAGVAPAEAIRMLGYEVVMAPKELLGGVVKQGDPDKLVDWVKNNIKDAVAAVVSSDALIYGGLIPSRNHKLFREILDSRVKNIASLKKENPNLNIYVFGSLMRTPSGPKSAGNEEPEYYQHCGSEIFQATGLLDKKDMQGLNQAEEKQLNELMDKIPNEVWQDWSERRKKNLDVSKKLIDLTRAGVLEYFVIGKDDNAPLSATHMESRKLAKYSKDLPRDKFQLLAGIDEFAMLLLTRAVDKYENRVPKIYVQYNIGKGGDIVPAFSDEPISNSVEAQITIAGAKKVMSEDEADFVLLVNTNPDGRTGDGISLADMPASSDEPRTGTIEFADMVEKNINKNYKVVVADIAFANGSDNALMKELRKRNLLMKLRGYAGWNTPTNSCGFAIGQGIIATRLPRKDYERLLMERYLDDYVYQGNVRREIMNLLCNKYGDPNLCLNLNGCEEEMKTKATTMIRQFAMSHLPKYKGIDSLKFYFPWHRTFEGMMMLP